MLSLKRCSVAIAVVARLSRRETGEHPDIDGLFGGPPFEGESFTLQDPDGRVTLYFTLSGGSLEEFRSEARQAKQAESWQ